MCRSMWLYDFIFWFVLFLKCYTSLTCSNCTVQYTTTWGLGKLFGCNNVSLKVCGRAPPPSSQWVSMWPSLMYFVTKSGFLLGDSYWWVSNYELMVYYVKIHFELKKDLLLQSLSSFLHVLTCRVQLLLLVNQQRPKAQLTSMLVYIDVNLSIDNI